MLGPVCRLYAATAALIVLILAIGVTVLGRRYDAALDNASHELRTLTRALAQEAARTFQSVDLVLGSVLERVVATGPGSFDRELGTIEIQQLLKEKISGLPQLDAITIINRNGQLINFSRYWPIPTVNVSDRDYFKFLQATETDQSFVSVPVQNRGTGTWTVYLARRISGPDDSFRGLVLGAMTVDYFERSFREVVEDDGMTVSLVRRDNVLLSRHPGTDAIGRTFPEFGDDLPDDGVERAPSPIDGKRRLKAYRRTPNYPLMVRVTMPMEDVLWSWRQQVLTFGIGSVVLIAAIVFGARMLGRQWAHAAELTEARAAKAEADALLEGQRQKLTAFEALRIAKEAAEEASRAKSDFLAMVSHELRTPLNAVIGFSEVMAMEPYGPLGDRRYREYVQDIGDSGRHLLGVINDILDLTKAEAGRLTLRPAMVDLSTLLHQACKHVRGLAERGGLTLVETGIEPGMVMNGDPQKIRQIAVNLLSNAVKFTPSGGRIEVSARCSETEACFEVVDNGIGISRGDLGRVLKPFMQVDSSLARKHEGTGLGLPLARAMAEAHGGTLTLQSVKGEGTMASVVLPRGILAEQPQQVTA
ncbi:sensor histidine kinase [Desertibaculum subflavum]|uniref:sensor histidine kinase n=1 Tax=Desertibaculum subflavum TaxID=2268458 RepID=UPI0013C4059C